MLNVYKTPANEHPICLKVKLPTVICPTRNLQLFLILAHLSYSKLHKTDVEEHQIVDL